MDSKILTITILYLSRIKTTLAFGLCSPPPHTLPQFKSRSHHSVLSNLYKDLCAIYADVSCEPYDHHFSCRTGTNSRIEHCTSDTITGPYTFHDVAVDVDASNSVPKLLPDGSYAIFHIGNGSNGPAGGKNCTSPDWDSLAGDTNGGRWSANNNSNNNNNSSNSSDSSDSSDNSTSALARTPASASASASRRAQAIHVSNSLNGPWTPLSPDTLPSCGNPAPHVHANGTYFIVCEHHLLYRSESIHGPWTLVVDLQNVLDGNVRGAPSSSSSPRLHTPFQMLSAYYLLLCCAVLMHGVGLRCVAVLYDSLCRVAASLESTRIHSCTKTRTRTAAAGTSCTTCTTLLKASTAGRMRASTLLSAGTSSARMGWFGMPRQPHLGAHASRWRGAVPSQCRQGSGRMSTSTPKAKCTCPARVPWPLSPSTLSVLNFLFGFG